MLWASAARIVLLHSTQPIGDQPAPLGFWTYPGGQFRENDSLEAFHDGIGCEPDTILSATEAAEAVVCEPNCLDLSRSAYPVSDATVPAAHMCTFITAISTFYVHGQYEEMEHCLGQLCQPDNVPDPKSPNHAVPIEDCHDALL